MTSVNRRYEPLAAHISAARWDEPTMRFSDVAAIVGPLPLSAFKYPAWWANSISHPEAQDGWLAAGWKIASLDLTHERVTYGSGLT
jgi:hypothetical protein